MVSQNLFAKTYGGTGKEYAYSVARTSDGGYIVAGGTASYGAGQDDFLVIKISPTGTPEWTRTFGGTNMDAAYSIIQTTDGGYMVAGETRSFVAGTAANIDFLALKISSTGNPEWARTFGGANEDFCRSIIQTSDGGYALVGFTRSYGVGLDDFLIIKISSAGALEWAKTFGGTNYDNAFSIVQTIDGGYVVSGSTMSFGAGYWDLLLLKLSPTGTLEWARTYGGENNDFTTLPVIHTADSGFMFTGHTESFGAGEADLLVMELSSTGAPEWTRTFGGTDLDCARSITRTGDGGFALAGWTLSFGAGSCDFFMIKISSAGSLEWARTFGGEGWDDPFSMIQTQDGAYTVAGWTTGSFDGSDPGDFLVIRLDQNGNYLDCIQSCSPTTGPASISISSPGADLIPCNPSITNPNPSVTTPGLQVYDVCPPSSIEEPDKVQTWPQIICVSDIRGVIFHASGEMEIKIYSSDGRLFCSEQLQRGQTSIPLGQGVYLWQAGPYKGKAVVR